MKEKDNVDIEKLIKNRPKEEQEFLNIIKQENPKNVLLAIESNFFANVSKRVINNIISGKTTFKNSHHNYLKKIKKQQKEEMKKYKPISDMKDILLLNKDIRDKIDEIPDNSVDYIITDPPYPFEYVNLYEDLSLFANRVLKDGGLLIVMVGQSYLPLLMKKLSKHMTYHWTCAYLTPGGQSVQLWQRNVNTFWKPLLIFSKGKYTGDWFGDVCKSDVNANDKRFHEWGQSVSGMNDIIERFTYPNDTIVDPFCGAGTTGVSCALLGRKFIGIDINNDCINTSQKRIKEVVCR